jgi:uncharacterized protein (DUF885 family)
MHLHKSVLSLVLFSLLAVGPAASAQEANTASPAVGEARETERFQQFLADDWKRVMEDNPEFATFLGVPGYNHLWSDQSWEGIERRRENTKAALKELESFERAQLSAADQLNYDLYRRNLAQSLEGDLYPRQPNGEPGFGGDLMPINQLGGVHSFPAQLLGAMPKFTAGHYDDIVARLEGLPVVIEQNLALMKMGLERGLTPPGITLRDVPEQVKAQIVDDPMESPLLQAFEQFPDSVSPADRERLTAAAHKAYEEGIRPAYQKLHDYLDQTYIPATREETAHAALPDGQAWYAFLARQFTTTDLTPDEIHEIGLGEVKRIRVEMDKIIEKTGFEGSFREFGDFLRTDPQFYYEDKEELLRDYRSIAKRADEASIKLFRRLPRMPYGIRPVPEYMEKSAPGGFYQPGSVEFGRPGYFYANSYNMKGRPKWEMEDLILHEAVPGHHFQIAIAQELERLPEFRKRNIVTAYVEGWGLYAESLGEDMGLLSDPYSKFGQLIGEIWRAVRLVVDTGLHSKGWSRQQAIDFFKENTTVAEHSIIVEVDRYIVIPGQALAYKMGELKIKELRGYAQEQLGESFDVRAFHDEVLGHGPLPLDVLESAVKASRPTAPGRVGVSRKGVGGREEGGGGKGRLEQASALRGFFGLGRVLRDNTGLVRLPTGACPPLDDDLPIRVGDDAAGLAIHRRGRNHNQIALVCHRLLPGNILGTAHSQVNDCSRPCPTPAGIDLPR